MCNITNKLKAIKQEKHDKNAILICYAIKNQLEQ